MPCRFVTLSSPPGECEPLYEDLPCKEICAIKTCEWPLPSTALPVIEEAEGGVLYIPDGTNVYLPSSSLVSSNNEAEYDAPANLCPIDENSQGFMYKGILGSLSGKLKENLHSNRLLLSFIELLSRS